MKNYYKALSDSLALAAALDIVKLDRGTLKFFDPKEAQPIQIVSGNKGKMTTFSI